MNRGVRVISWTQGQRKGSINRQELPFLLLNSPRDDDERTNFFANYCVELLLRWPWVPRQLHVVADDSFAHKRTFHSCSAPASGKPTAKCVTVSNRQRFLEYARLFFASFAKSTLPFAGRWLLLISMHFRWWRLLRLCLVGGKGSKRPKLRLGIFQYSCLLPPSFLPYFTKEVYL